MSTLPEAPLSRVLDREDHIWHGNSGGAPHIFMYGATGSAKSSLIKAHLTRLCQQERVLVVEVKRQADPVFSGTPEDPWQWGRPVREICPRFGYEGEPGGGPMGMWYRIIGAPDRADTARRIGAALEIVANEGHTILVLDDVKTTCKALGLDEQVGEAMSLGRSAGVCCILSTTETSYVAGRSQGGLIWVGHTGGGIPAAKAGAGLLGWRGREREDFCGTLPRYTWIFSETEAGNMGPVLTRTEPQQSNRTNGFTPTASRGTQDPAPHAAYGDLMALPRAQGGNLPPKVLALSRVLQQVRHGKIGLVVLMPIRQ